MSSPEPTPAQKLATRLGILTPSDEVLDVLQFAIEDAEDDVVTYLGRPIYPVQRTAGGLFPLLSGWNLPTSDPVRRIVSTTAEHWPDGSLTGTFTVVYEVGLDYLNDPELRPIRRYVLAAAQNDPNLLQYLTRHALVLGQVQSVSVSTEGQSKTVTRSAPAFGGGGQAGSDSPGALPSKTSLDRWRLANRRVHAAPDRPRRDWREWWYS